MSPAPFYLAQEHGLWTTEGVGVEFRFFEAAQPIAAAAVSGDIDVGVTALTGGFFSLAGKGTLKVIGGGMHEQKGFELTAFLVSKKAYEAGLTDISKMPGHSFGLTQYGSSFHYMMGRIAQGRGFDIKSVTLRPLQTIGNMVAAVRTGQVDATMAIASMARPLIDSGEVVAPGLGGRRGAVPDHRPVHHSRHDRQPQRHAASVLPGLPEWSRANTARHSCASAPTVSRSTGKRPTLP